MRRTVPPGPFGTVRGVPRRPRRVRAERTGGRPRSHPAPTRGDTPDMTRQPEVRTVPATGGVMPLLTGTSLLLALALLLLL